MRFLAAGFWIVGGVMHFVIPRQYEAIVPSSLRNWRKELVIASGIAEIAGGLLILPRGTRRAGRWWSLATLAAVPRAHRDGAARRAVSEDPAGRAVGAAAAAVPARLDHVARDRVVRERAIDR